MFQLLDGRGRGHRAEVNNEFQLETRSVAVPNLHDKTVKYGDTYFLQYLFEQQAGDTEELMGTFTYTGDRQLLISKMYVSSHEKADNSNTIFTLYAQPTITGGGTVWGAMNLNAESARTLSIDMISQYNGNFPITASSMGTHFYSATTSWGNPTFILDAFDCFVMKKGLTIGITCKSTTANTLTQAYFIVYEQDRISA